MWKWRADAKRNPQDISDPTGVVTRLRRRANAGALGALLLLVPTAAGAQDQAPQVPMPPPVMQQQIAACIENDPLTCPVSDRLRLITNISREIQNVAGEIGLFCELQPADCPSLESVDRLHGYNQAMGDLIWGLPRYKLETMQSQSQVTSIRPLQLNGPGREAQPTTTTIERRTERRQ